MTARELRARLQEIRANRNNVQTEIVNLEGRLHDAPAEERSGLEERRTRQNAALQNLDNERVEIQGELETLETDERARVRELAADPSNRESGDGAGDRERRAPASGELDGALRAIERHSESMSSPDAVERALRRDHTGLGSRYLAAVADDDYSSAFGLILAHGDGALMRMSSAQQEAVRRVADATEARALAEGVGSTGGFGVPFALDPTIILTNNGAINPIRDLASTITVATSEWKGVSSAGVTASFAAEATEASDNSPTLAQPVIHLEKAQAFIPFSIEVGQDYAGLQGELTGLLIDAKAVLEATEFLTGAGHASSKPEGLFTGLTNTQRVQTAVSKTFAMSDVYAVLAAMPPRFRVDAEWTSAPSVLDGIFKAVGEGSTEPKLLPTRDGPMLGLGVHEWSTMSTATTTTGSKILVIGDWDEFRIADRIGMNIEVIQTLFGASQRPTGQRGLYAYWRTGSTVLVPNAFRFLEVL